MNFTTWSYRFAEEVLNGKIETKREIEDVIRSIRIVDDELSKPRLNELFKEEFRDRNWEHEIRLFEEPGTPMAKIDFLKNRVGIEVAFTHSSFLGIDLLKLQTLSYSNLDKIDVGVYIVGTKGFMNRLKPGSITFEKAKKYLPHFRSAIQVPIWVVGLEG